VGSILIWWLLISLMGVAAIPITVKTFKFLPDRGYGFSKPLGLILVGLLVWLIGFIHFSIFSIVLSFGLLCGFSYWLWVKYKDEIKTAIRERLGYILVAELFFATLFLLFLFFRMYNPDILGTEKFMDMAFMNSMTRITSIPPFDPWLSGSEFHISYYYFGYLLMSIMTKVSGVAPAIAFNLSLGLLFALSGISTFSVLYNLTRRMSVAVGGWSGLYMLGNLEGFRQVMATKSIENFNWWTPSRVIPDTINEFPFFSYLLGDMHPHMLSVPFIMICLGLTLNHLKSPDREITYKDNQQLGQAVLWGLMIGALGFMNSWDMPTTFFMAGLAIFFQQYRQRPTLASLPWKGMLGIGVVIFAFMIIPYIPFYMHFHSQAKGIAWTTQNTKVSDFFLIFGLFAFMTLTFVLARYHAWFVTVLSGESKQNSEKEKNVGHFFCAQCGEEIRAGKKICGKCGFRSTRESGTDESQALIRPLSDMPRWVNDVFFFLLQPVAVLRQGRGRLAAIILGSAVVLTIVVVLLKVVFFGKADNPLPYLLGILMLFLFAIGVLLSAKIDKPETMFALIAFFTAGLLLFGCETLHINDTFNAPLDRMNTVFKFYYQSWFLLGIASVYGLVWAFKYSMHNTNLKLAWCIPLVLLIAASLVYPYAGTMIKTNRFNNYTTLDGSLYLNNSYATDRAGIEWLRKNVKGNPVVLEATGGEYTDFARVSTFTGLPTVLGWGGHELQWRGNYDEPGKRIPDIDTMYGSTDVTAARTLLDKYNVYFVFVGTLERQKYSEEGLGKFALFMDKAYEQPGGVIIYRRR
jgi:uncharacterized membrane protein